MSAFSLFPSIFAVFTCLTFSSSSYSESTIQFPRAALAELFLPIAADIEFLPIADELAESPLVAELAE